ncbi:universal stress protein [Actinosynnema pretiosum subsp. pretiosum]|uniref:UspA domain protein n=2 Tax=Actinosynnema TaxID=40566 RepID=C6WFE8_ACTMD|nr:universal stress protein [Actinosynnema mirum]ACU35883.1 UspA domain protein [Actinosynnema mirum DSM 43827]AXX29307.1 Universal stress protein family [Actinosynnema pretiosum subsp. pretiosum]QUF06437.1 universal stress protein [Actinosynnema pretiosum subsp. pretiosum]
MGNRIVVGVDGSPASADALRWAVEEAGQRGCSVDAVIVWQIDPGMVLGPVSGAEALAIDPETTREGYMRLLESMVAQFDVNKVFMEGEPGRVLVEVSKDADLLVVGSRGRGLLREALTGSVSSYCVHHAECPVVVLREREPAHA